MGHNFPRWHCEVDLIKREMEHVKKINKFNKIFTATIFMVAVALICAIIVTPATTASAEESTEAWKEFYKEENIPTVDWEEAYNAYVQDSAHTDWYFDEEYTDLFGAVEEMKKILDDPLFDKEAMKADPIVIAVIDFGISCPYQYNATKNALVRIGLSANIDAHDPEKETYPVYYALPHVFDDVLLQDKDGNFVYYNAAETLTSHGNSVTIANTNDIAHDLVSSFSKALTTVFCEQYGTISFMICGVTWLSYPLYLSIANAAPKVAIGVA